MNLNKSLKGSVAAFIANAIFGFSFLFSKVALDTAPPLVILSLRFTTAFVVLNILWIARLFKLNFRHKPIGKLIIMALAQPLLYFIFELYGISNTSSAMSGVIISLVPVAVIILSTLFLKERPSALQIIGSAVSLVAVAVISIISNNQGKSNLLGIVLLVLAVICAAVFNILSRSESSRFSPFEKTYMMFLIGTIGFNLIAAVSLKGAFIPLAISALKSPQFLVSLGYLALLSSIGAFMLYNFATSAISTVRAASFANITTVVSLFAGVLILKENLSLLQFVCCAFIILGVWIVNVKNEKTSVS